MSSKILFIFEGARTEAQIVSSLQKYFVNESTSVECVYGAEIYQIYKEIVADNDLDTFNLLKERNAETKELLSRYTRDNFAEIYLFFDYDGHSTLAEDKILLELLEFFKEETDKGKLYVSYPMVEALKHVPDYNAFKDLAIACKEKVEYKKIVNESCNSELMHLTRYSKEIWHELIKAHLKKANYIVSDSFSLPTELISQLIIFSKQMEKYINVHLTVAVLSAFPVFLHDYYGNEEIKKRIVM